MSSLSERARRLRTPAAHGAPRVGIVRGAIPNDRPVVADVRRNLPAEVLDPVAMDAMREQARTDGYQAGYAAGIQQARIEAAAQHEQAGARFGAAMDALLAAVDDLRDREVESLHHVADQTALLALRIAEVVLQREIATSTDPGREAIARAMPLIPEDGTVRVHLHPEDLEVLGPVTDMLPGREVELVADASVSSGGCVVSVGATRVDAQIPAALARVQDVLR